MINPSKIHDQLVTLGEEWAQLNAAADLLEYTEKTLISQLGLSSNESSAIAKKDFALRHPSYIEHINKMVEARREANKAKVRYDSAKVFCELKRTEAANDRATMRTAT